MHFITVNAINSCFQSDVKIVKQISNSNRLIVLHFDLCIHRHNIVLNSILDISNSKILTLVICLATMCYEYVLLKNEYESFTDQLERMKSCCNEIRNINGINL